MLIYIVEDDTDIRELETYALKNSGYEVKSFGESKSFFKACAEIKPQLVILDVMLPDFDGLSVLEKLRKDKSTKNIPVILVTAKSSEMDKVKGLDMGADDYLTKPFSVLELISRVRAILRRCTVEEKPETVENSAGLHTRSTNCSNTCLTIKVWHSQERTLLLMFGVTISRERAVRLICTLQL